MTEPATRSVAFPAQAERSGAAPQAYVPRGLARDLMDELAVRGRSPEFWSRFWRLAPFLRREELDFLHRAAGSPPLQARPAPARL